MGLWVFQKAQHVVKKLNTLSVVKPKSGNLLILRPSYDVGWQARSVPTPLTSEAPANAKLAASPVSGSLLCFLEEAFVGEAGVVGVAGVSGFLV